MTDKHGSAFIAIEQDDNRTDKCINVGNLLVGVVIITVNNGVSARQCNLQVILIKLLLFSRYYRLATGQELNVELEREPITEDIGELGKM